MNWVFAPTWGTRLIVLLAVSLLVLVALRWWRERRGGSLIVLRAITIAALGWVMLNPEALIPRERTGKPRLIVLYDTSGSMATRDAGTESRAGIAGRRVGAPQTVSTLQAEFDVELRGFDRLSGPLDWSQLATNVPSGNATELGAALMSAVSDIGNAPSQAGVLIVSDGRETGVNALEAAQLALARSVPLWTWTVGGPIARKDVWVETAASEALAFSGAEVELAATLRTAGYPHRSFIVELVRDGKAVVSREAIPDTNGQVRVAFRVKAPPEGEDRYLFRVAAQAEEADTANNERAVFLRSVGSKVRILLAEGQPHWDTKFLVQSLKRDPNVDVTAVYRLNAARHVAVVSSTGSETRVEKDLFPRSAAAMNAFDVILLGRGAEAFFDPGTEALLTDFVSRRGGTLVFARGKPYGGRFQALAKLEPVAWGEGTASAIKLRPTEAGRDNPIFDLGASGTLDELLEKLPALDHAAVTLGEKPLAVVLANAAQEGGPVLIAYQRYGQGKTLSLNASGLWRWAFRESAQEESEAAYRRFWISLLQWLMSGSQFMPGADVALTSARRHYTSEQPMQFLIATRNLDPASYHPKLIISNATQRLEVEPRARGSSFVAEAGPFPPGTYRVSLLNNVGQPAELAQSIDVLNASVETRDLSADPALMANLAKTSGGAVISGGDVQRLPEIVRQWELARQLAHRQQPIWDRWWLLTGLVALLGIEWWLRRREGLL